MHSTIGLRAGRMFQAAVLAGCVLFLAHGSSRAQSLEEKLSARPDFIPSNPNVTQRLIEIAQHYQIPMGIEWFWETNEQPPIPAQQSTVLALIKATVSQPPGYIVDVQSGMVRIRHESFSGDRLNFLNLSLADFKADKVNVLGAQWLLRSAMNRTLHPALYARGSNGGYGIGRDRKDKFDVENISFPRSKISVREVLNGIVNQNGNALWIVEFTPSKPMNSEPFFAQRVSGEDVDTRFVWRIIPLTRR